MQRNSGITGLKKVPSQTDASGIHDTFDQYNSKRINTWPIIYTYSLSANSGTIFENTGQTFTLTTTGYTSNTTLYWTISHVSTSSSDFYNFVTSGSFVQSGATNTGSFSVITTFIGNTAKSTRTFQIQIRTGSASGPVVYTSGTFSIPPITISGTSVSTTSINEGGSFTIYFNLGQMGVYTGYYATIGVASGTATLAGDFTTYTSSAYVNGPYNYTYTFTASADATTEGNETITLYIAYNNTWAIFSTVTINDTSLTPTASLSPSANPIDEGSTMTFTVTTTNFPSGTLYWTLENVSNWEGSDQSAVSGSFTVSGSSGTFSFTITSDGYTEGTEQFLARVRLNSTTGTIIGTSATISINDTSTGTSEPSGLVGWSGDVITSTAGSNSASPGMCNIWFRRSIVMFAYTAAELSAAFGGATSATITGLRFYVVGQPTNQPLPNYAIGMKNGTFGVSNPGATGYTIVKNSSSESFTTSTNKQWYPLDTSFVWTGGDLAIAVAWGQCPINYAQSGQNYIGSGTLYYNWTDSSGTWLINNDSAPQSASGRPVLQLYRASA